MAMFSRDKKHDSTKEVQNIEKAKKADAKVVKVPKKDAKPKKVNKKDAKVTKKTKKVSKLKGNGGANLTKSPGRIIKSPRITEKAMQMTVNDVYVFEVAMDATKRDIVTAVNAIYGVVPRKVNIVRKNTRAFVARFRNRRGKKTGMKKAYVFLKKGDKIDIV